MSAIVRCLAAEMYPMAQTPKESLPTALAPRTKGAASAVVASAAVFSTVRRASTAFLRSVKANFRHHNPLSTVLQIGVARFRAIRRDHDELGQPPPRSTDLSQRSSSRAAILSARAREAGSCARNCSHNQQTTALRTLGYRASAHPI